jgi:hypothetical protein
MKAGLTKTVWTLKDILNIEVKYMALFYFHDPLGGLISLGVWAILLVALILFVLKTFGVFRARKSNDEKVNPLTFSLSDKNDKKNE